MKIAKLLLTILVLSTKTYAQNSTIQDQKLKLSMVFGLNQPVLARGFNFEVNYYTKHFVFDYSHGFNLHFQDNLVTGNDKKQHLKFKISHSLGIGMGYRVSQDFNIRIEPKVHLWKVHQDDKSYSKTNIIKRYTTYTLGLGAYYRWRPFHKVDNFSSGITVVPSIRWWPNVASSLPNNEFEYFNTITNKNEIHRAKNIGVSNSPFFGNISIGYSLK